MLSGAFSCSSCHVEVEFKNRIFEVSCHKSYCVLYLCRTREHGGDKRNFGFTADRMCPANFVLTLA